MNIGYSLRDVLAREADISQDPAGGTLVDKSEWPVDVVLGISSTMGFPTPLVEVATRICGRNIKALIYCGSTGNYISDSLVPTLGMEVVPEKDFKMLEMANKTIVKA